MFRRIALFVLLANFGATAVAQDSAPPQRPDGGKAGPGAAKDRKKAPGRRTHTSLAVIEQIASDLRLSEEQRRQYDEIAAAHREQLDANRPTGDEQQKIAADMAKARKAGDLARAAELRDQLVGNPDGKAVDRFIDEITPLLTGEQREQLPQIREDYAARRAASTGDAVARAKMLRSELAITGEQTSEYSRLIAQLEADIAEGKSRQSNSDELLEELRKAAESGDDEGIRAVGARINESQNAQTKALAAFYDSLDKILTDPQRDKLDSFRARHGDRPAAMAGARDPREIFRAARRLKLNDDQRQQLRALEDEFGKKVRDKRGDKDGMTALAAEAETEVRQILSADQSLKFDRLLGVRKPDDAKGAERGSKRAKKPATPADSEPDPDKP